MNRPSILAFAFALGGTGCVSLDEQPVFFDVELEPVGGTDFVTPTGWTVTLARAMVAVGPVYLRDEGLRFRSGSHGGDADAIDETLAAELIQQVAFDLTGDPVPAGVGRGSVRTVDVLEPVLEPPSPWVVGDATALRDAPAVVRGTATRDAQVIEFLGALPYVEHDEDADAEPDEEHGHAGELELDPFVLSDGGTLTVIVDPSAWFADAQFDQLTLTDPQGRWVITPASQVGVAWEKAQVDAFTVAWTPGEGDATGPP